MHVGKRIIMSELHEEARVMLQVFNACIKTGVYPKPDSPCHKKLEEIISGLMDEETKADTET